MQLNFFIITLISSLFFTAQASVVVINSSKDIKIYHIHEDRVVISSCEPFIFPKDISDCHGPTSTYEGKFKENHFIDRIIDSLVASKGQLEPEFIKNFDLFRRQNEFKKLQSNKRDLAAEKTKIEDFVSLAGADSFSDERLAEIEIQISETERKLTELKEVPGAALKINNFIDSLMNEIKDPKKITTYSNQNKKDLTAIIALQQSVTMTSKIAVGASHTCVITAKSTIECWGGDTFNKLVPPSGLQNPRELALGWSYACVIDDNGVQCWGGNKKGQTNVPSGLKNPRHLATGDETACVITDTGVECWGSGANGVANVPKSLVNPKALSKGSGIETHMCAIDDNGIQCWGDNSKGQLDVPKNIVNPYYISTGFRHSCALAANGTFCWGENKYNQTIIDPNLKNITSIALNDAYTCLIDSGAVRCWGSDVHRSKIDNPPRLDNPRQLFAGNKHICALTDSGIVCWGQNGSGQTDVPLLAL